MKSFNKQTGFALITAMVVLALVTSVTVAMTINQRHNIELSTDMFHASQSKHHAEAVFYWANGLLIDDLITNATDSQDDIWNQGISNTEIENGNGEVDAVIEDLQSRFNINNLALAGNNGEIFKDRFRRLLQNIGVDVDITGAIADWADKDSEVRFPSGAEDDYYLSLDKPYRTGNQPFVSITELLLVKDVTRDIFLKLAPHISALPAGVGININTASDEVLLSLSDAMSAGGVELLKQLRQQGAIGSVGSSGTADNNNNDAADVIDDRVNASSSSSGSSAQTNAPPSDWTWTSLKEQYEKQQNQSANSSQNNSASSNSSGLSSSSSISDQINNRSDDVQSQSLSESGFTQDYELDATGLTTSSSYFRVFAQIEQHEKTLQVEYVLHRDANSGEISLISRKYNGLPL